MENIKMTECGEVKLKDICKKIYSGGTPKSSETVYYGGNIPWLNTKEVHFNRIYRTEQNISELGFKNSSAKFVPENNVIVAMYGATAGNVAVNKIPLTTNQACCNLIINDSIASYEYVYYSLLINHSNLASLANGGAQQNLNSKQIREFAIPLPPLDVQKRIAGILGALDDRIDVLRRENVVLEQMAQAVFQSWFVDFDIVRAKAAGLPAADVCKKYHITPDIYDLFPSAFSADNLPLGWEKKKLGDILNISSGKRPPVKSENMTSDFYIPVYGGNGIGWYTKEPLISDGKKVIITGRVGTLGEVYRICSDAWISDNALIFYTSNDNYEFLYFWIKKINFSSYNRGAAQPLITQGDMKEIECVYPEIIIESFHNLTASCFDKIYENEKQIRTLEQTRDTLLPKLMKGEIEI